MEIKKVLERKDGIKMIIIPKNMDVKKGDSVGIIKIDEKEVIENARRRNKN